MKFSLRKLYILTVILSLAFASGVFAQENPVSNIEIDVVNKTLSVYINQTISGGDISFAFENTTTGDESIINELFWDEGNFDISLGNWDIEPPYVSAGGIQYNNLHIDPSEGDDYYIELSEIFNNNSLVTVDFPGWETAEYRQIDGTDQYYPYVKSDGLLTRTPSDAPLYLSLHNMTTSTYSVIETYPGSQYLDITWPNIEINTSPLIPGNEYEIFLSDIPDGTSAVDTGDSEYTLINLGNVPVSSGGGGDDNQGGGGDDNQGGGGDDNQGGGGDGSTNSGGNTNNQGGGIIDNTQANILSKGIVPTDCGYNLSGTEKDSEGNLLPKGKICGFGNAISLIQRVIEYIFILILPIAAIVFAYAGFLYLTSGGSADKRKAAKKAMTSVLIGIIVVMAAWLLVKTLVVALGVNTGASWFYLAN